MTPEGLSATGGDGKNTLQWQPITQLRDATPVTVPVHYQIYRSVDGGAFAKIGEPLTAATFTDTTVENGRDLFLSGAGHQHLRVRER